MTENLARLRRHQRELGLDKGWSSERFLRLCRMLNLTSEETAALCCIDSSSLKRWLTAQRFPPHASLMFYMLESSFLLTRYGIVRKPAIPVHLIPNN